MARSLRSLFLACLATGLLAASASAEAGVADCASLTNLVVDCGFESGTLDSWNPVNADPNFDSTSALGQPHSGDFAASFGNPRDSIATISQMLVTIPGAQYAVSFWLASERTIEGDPDNGFSFSWDAATPYSVSNASETPYTLHSFMLNASNALTKLSFSGFDTAYFLDLDDVSVVALDGPPTTVPEPASIVLLSVAGGAAVLQSRRRKTGRAT